MSYQENEHHQSTENAEQKSPAESPEQQILHPPTTEELQNTITQTESKIGNTKASKAETEAQLAEVRSSIGLPQNNETPHSIQSADERLSVLTKHKNQVKNELYSKPNNESREPEPYSAEADRNEIGFKAKKIREWATEQGWKEGEDFLVIEDLGVAVPEGEKLSRHETKQFAVAIRQDHYKNFKDYILGKYAHERQTENPKNQTKLNFSWAGRFLVGWEGVPFDTVPVESMRTGAKSHHAKFKQFFKEKTGIDFPEVDQLNQILHDISQKGLDIYIQQKDNLQQLRAEGKLSSLPDHGDSLLSGLDHTINILKKAATGKAVKELPEQILQMPEEMRWYADLTYNAEDIKDYGQLGEITGIPLPDNIRIDKIYDRWNFDRKKMEDICREFSEKLYV